MEDTMKSIIQLALETESRGMEYFSYLAEKCNYNEGVRNILMMLSREQKKQVDLLNGWANDGNPDYSDSAYYADSKVILQDLSQRIADFSCAIDHLALYQHARDIQAQSLENYKAAAEQVAEPNLKAFVHKLIGQKERQIILLDNIIELLLRPEQWVESPEFTKLDEY